MNYQAAVFENIKALNEKGRLNDIDAVMVGGSLSRTDNDMHSDIDLFLLLKTELPKDSISDIIGNLIEQIGTAKLITGPIFTPDFGNIYTAYYHDLLICQFIVNDKKSLRPNPMNKLPSFFLFDKSGFYSDFIAGGNHINVDFEKAFISSANRLLLRIIGAQKELIRSNLWLAIRFLSDIRENLITLERLANGTLPKGINFHKTSKAIEKELNKKFLSDLKLTLPIYDKESIVNALIQTLEIFKQIVPEFTVTYKIDFSTQLEIADQLLLEMRSLDML